MNGIKRLALFLVVFCAAATALAANQESFKFATWNIGHFAHGSSATPTAAYSNSESWNAALDALGADVIAFQEYHPTMYGGANTAETIGTDYTDFYATALSSYTCNALWFKSGMGVVEGEPHTKVYDTHESENNRNFFEVVRIIDDKEVHFISTQLTYANKDDNTVSLGTRRAQITELYAYCKDFDYVVLSGDFNCGFGVDELNVFMENGWECVNENPCLPTCSAFAIDNILLKGLTASEIGRYDTGMALSDHMALYCTLRFGEAADYQEVIDENLFHRRQAITFPGYKGTTTLRNFPALVRVSGLNENSFRFTDEEGHLLAFDVDELNAEGESIVWVRIPEFNAQTKIYLYYAPTEAAILPSVDSASVWADYAGVWHMNEAGTVSDASGHNLAANPASGVSSSVTSDGVIGSAVEKTGSLEVDNVYALTGDDKFNYANFTASGWYQWPDFASVSGNPTVIGKGGWTSGGWYVQHKSTKSQNITLVINKSTDGTENMGNLPKVTENWNYVAVVVVTNSLTLYVNGEEVYRNNNKLATSTTDKFIIGSCAGLADETRLMRRGRSADFIAADYAQVVDDEFAVFGAVEALDDTVLVNPPLEPENVVFNGLCQRPELEGEGYTVDYGEGDYIQSGTYEITLSLVDKEDSTWANGSTEDIVYSFVIGSLDITVTLGEPVKEGKEITGYNLNFTALSTPSSVYAVWGDEDWGDRAADWAQVELVENYVAAGATMVTVPVPAGWSKAAKFLRYILVPSGIRQLEYITGTGTQYIDTGLKPSGYVKTTVEASLSEKTSQQRLFGTAITDAPIPSDCLEYELYISGASSAPGYICRVGSASWANTGHGTWSINTRSTWMMDAATAKLHEPAGDFSCSWSGDRTTAKAYNNLYLFTTGRVPSQSDMIAHGNIYTATVYDRVEGVDTLLRDYLPVEFAGKVGLWDNVEKKFYPSAGSGDFVAGPESGEETLVLPDLPMFATSGLSPLIDMEEEPEEPADPLEAIRPASYTGPKIAIIGDSYSAFPGTIDTSHDVELDAGAREYWYETQPANGVTSVMHMWWYQVIQNLDGYFICNDAWSGTALCEYSWGCTYGNAQAAVARRQMCNRLGKTLPTEVEPDVVLLLAGTNDAWIRYDQNGGAKSGASVIDAFIGETWADPLAKPANHGANMLTMKPGFAQTVWWIREKFPHAKIMFIANKDEKISDNFSAALEEMAKVTGCKFLQLDVSKIAKISGHPTAEGMAELSRQVTAAYNAWANDGFAIDGLEAMGEEVEGVPTASGDAQIGRLNTDYGYLRVVENSSRHYAVMVVTNTTATYEIELPAGKTNEYLVVGGGGSGGAVNNGTFAGAGGGAAVREGFHRWSGTDPVTLSVTVGASGTTTGGGTGGKGGTTKIEFSDGTPFIYADGGGAGGNWQGNGGDSEGSGGGGGSGNNERTLGGKHIGSSWLLGSDGGNGNNDSEANRSCIPGGGGGAGGPGGNGTKTVEGAGGPGVVRHITGSPVEYAAGGLGTRTKTISAAASTGSGGSSYLGEGGSGIAAFRYELTDEEYAEIMQTVPRVIAKPTLPQSAATYDGSDFKPGFSDSDAYTVAYSADEWINGGTYAVTFRLREGGQWEGDGSTADVVLNFVIRQAENEWTTAPSISKSSWLEKVDEPGVITAAAKYGEVQILYPGLATEMPTIPGDYIATVSVEATDNWLGLEVEIPFTITMNGAARTPVTVPEVPPAGTVPYDESNHKPTVVGTDAYTVTMTEGEWIEPGVYYLTLALTDPDNTMWADETVQNRVYAYIIKQGPTMTTGTRVPDTTVVESWGEHYVLCDDKSGRFYQLVVVTNAGVDANWTVPAGVQVEYLLIGGGGGGGGIYNYAHGGGGGAGGVLADFIMGFDAAQVVVLNVGAGGTSGANANGKDTVLKCGGEIILNAPGGGGCPSSSAAGNSSSGGSGAGGASSGIQSGGLHLEGTGPAAGALGHNGAASKGNYWSGGGGGAGGDGGVDRDGGAHKEGNGGIGLDFGITGEIVGYAGGGAGDGGIHSHGGGEYGNAATANTGGGGGGGGGTGASGIAVLRYEVSEPAHPVRLPEGLASDTFAYDGTERKPSVATSRDYEVAFSAGNWTDAGVYTVTLSLTDPECWWADDETSTDKVFTFTITQAANAWLTTPTLTKTSWREGEEAGVLSAEAKFGAWRVDYGATDETMPTEMGSYVAAVIVDETANYSGLREEIPFEIVSSDAKLEVLVPSAYADTSRPYDASSCKPADVSTEQYTVSFEDANWTDAGSYTVTVALTDKEGTIWADTKTTADKTFTYTVTRASNAWVSMPTISPSSWVKGSASGVISAEPKWGDFAISFGTSGAEMPTDAGEYVAQVSVKATENWEGLGPVAVPFEILGKPILGRALRVVSTEKSGGKYSSFTLSLDDKNMPGSLYIAYGDIKGGLTTNGWEQVAKVGDYEGGVAYNQIVANLPAGLGTDYRYFRFIFVPSTFDPSLYAAQEDLIAFWDGVLNDGPGNPHADAPAAWTDIIGCKRFTFSTTKPTALANGFRFTGSQTGSMTSEDTAATFAQAVEGTVEAAFKRSERSQTAAVLQGPVSTGISLCWLDYDKVMAGCTSGSKYCPTLSPGTGFFVTSADYSNKLATNICVNGGAVYLIGSSYLTGITTTTALLANRGTGQPYQFKGDIYAIRLYRRPLTDEERQLNAHLDQFRYNGKEDELATATAVYNAGYVVELPNEVILSASYANWGATSANNVPMADNALVGITPTGSADWQYTEKNYSTTTWTDGNLTTYGTQVKNGATMTYEFPMERSVYEFRWYVASWSGRDRISIKSLVVEDAAGNKTALYPQSFDYTPAGNKYVVFASSDGRPIAVHAKRLMLTYGTGQNNGNNIAELEARCSDEVAVGTIERVPMSVGGYLTDGISGQVSPVATRVVVRYSTDQYEVESADCPSVEVTPGADGRFSVALADMAKGVQVYVRVVAMNAETLANSSVLAFVSSPLLLAGEGGRMYFAADGSGDVIHEFTNAETVETFIAPDKNVKVSYLLVGGGGGGGGARASNTSKSGGGGGGGSVVEAEVSVAASALCTIQVGRGGIGGILNTVQTGVSDEHNGADGGASTLVVGETVVASAVGGGGGRASASNSASGNGGISGENAGGTASAEGGGGGAGAGANGGSNSNGGPGGNGASVDASWGLEHKVGAGGGGGFNGNYTDRGGVGGDYGGGHGASRQTIATAGSYYGAGGGGGDAYGASATDSARGIGASGANGIVLIRYTPPVPPVVFKLVERGPGFLRVECVINELDAPSAELSIASGADAEHLGAYQQCSAAAVVGDAFTNTVVGLNAATDWTFSAKVVTTAGTKYYTGVFTTTEAIASAVPTLADVAVAIPDAASGTVEASAFVAWGGEKSAKCELVLKYGKVSGTYTKERVISAADIGTIRSTTTLTRGTWYAVLVARSSEGESAVSQEFELYSEKPRKSTVFYLK